MLWRGPKSGVALLIDIEHLDRALDKTLDAAMDGSQWQGLLEEIAVATNALGANVLPLSERTSSAAMFTPSLDGAFEDYFKDGWNRNDWHMNSLPVLMRHGVARDLQYTPREVFERHGFYRFLRKHNIGHAVMIEWHLSTEDRLILAIHRRQGEAAFTEQEAHVLQAVRQKLQDAGRVMYQLSRNKLMGIAEGFEMAGVAVVFFDRFCKITHVNQGAARILGGDLQITQGELRGLRSDDTSKIRDRMRAVLTAKWLMPTETSGPIVIEREGNKPILLRIQRLGGNFPDFFSGAVGVCIIDVSDKKPPAYTQALRDLFGLTAQEAAIALQLNSGMSPREIAEASSRSYETVRTQVKSILQKTGTRRQAELIALIGKLRIHNADMSGG